MKLKYKVFLRESDGRVHQSAGAFARIENAKKAIKKYYRIAEHGTSKILAWKIVDLETNETIEQNGQM